MTKCNDWRTNGLLCAVWVIFACASVGADTNTLSVAQLTDAELIKEYETAGLTLAGTGMEPTDEPIARIAWPFHNARVQAVKAEIVRRGSAVVPALIAFLEQEAPKERTDPGHGLVLSFTGDALGLLAQIGDTKGAPIALRILEGWDGKVNKWEQSAALGALERLTHFCFHKVRPHHRNYADSVEHPNAMVVEFFAECATPARLYKQWMEGEGRYPSKWVGMATQQARQLLASEDLEQVYCAAAFLRPAAGRDNTPDATLARLAEIVGKMKKGRKQYSYEFAGKPVPVSFANWVNMVSNYGPRARPYAATLLRIQKEQDRNYWSGYAELRKVGGPEVMSFLFDVLPKISAKAARISSGSDARGGFSSDDPRGWWLDSQREVRYGIDRWAGRVFDSDADRLAWWEANKGKPPQEWLAANLDVVAEQVDKGVLWAEWIAREVLPDLPVGASENIGSVMASQDVGMKRVEGPFRVKWLHEHRPELRYDEDAGCYRLIR